jgi:hypothetical protein
VNLRYSANFQKTAPSKQPPNGRKFAQSGHPGANVRMTRQVEKNNKDLLPLPNLKKKIT